MRGVLIAFVVALAFIAAGCERRQAASNGPGPSPAPAEDEGTASRPTKAEIIDYLDGKEIDLGAVRPGDKAGPKHVVRKEQIEAVQLADSASSVNDGPWSIKIDFLLNTGPARYAVTARVEHKRVDKKRAFYGFSVEQVARQ